MTRKIVFLAAALLAAVVVAPVHAKAVVGEPAPAFTLVDSHGKSHALSEYAGKTVVLEWHNPGCPFVKKHYGAGNMQKQQKDATAGGVVWLAINTSAKGKQGHLDDAGANAMLASNSATPSAYLFDRSGDVGRAYAAKTTPHMYVIDGTGVLRYMGAIDSNPSSDADDIPGATQYVSVALAELAAGKPVTTSVTQPYGCSVKY